MRSDLYYFAAFLCKEFWITGVGAGILIMGVWQWSTRPRLAKLIPFPVRRKPERKPPRRAA